MYLAVWAENRTHYLPKAVRMHFMLRYNGGSINVFTYNFSGAIDFDVHSVEGTLEILLPIQET